MKNGIAFLLILSAYDASAGLEGTTRSVTVELPGGSSQLESAAPQTTRQSVAKSSWLEVAMSSWGPSSFEGFESKAIPYVSMSASTDLGPGFRAHLGLGVRAMSRAGAIDLGGASYVGSQSLFLVPLRAGFEMRSPGSKKIEPFAAVSALPCVALAPRGDLDRGSAALGMALEGVLGVRTDLGGTLPGPDFGLSAIVTIGQIDGASVTGWGMQLSYRPL